MGYKQEYERELDLFLHNPKVRSVYSENEIQEIVYNYWIQKESDDLQKQFKGLIDFGEEIKFLNIQTKRNEIFLLILNLLN